MLIYVILLSIDCFKVQGHLVPRLYKFIKNMMIMFCNQLGITLAVSFCEHSLSFVKIDHVMGHGITSCLPHPCTIGNLARHDVGL